MKPLSLIALLLMALVLGGAAPARAAEAVLHVDPATSQVAFTLGATAHTVHGTFKLKGGDLRFDPATGAVSGAVVVDAASGQTGNSSRDRKMHAEVLESAQFPEVVFTLTRIEGLPGTGLAGPGTHAAQVRGTIAIHGATHELSVPMKVTLDGNGVDANGSFRIPFVEWGMKDPSVFVLRVEKFVTVEVTIRGRVSAS